MPIKTLLMPIRESDTSAELIETGLLAAKQFNAHLDLLYVHPDPKQMLPYATLGLSGSMKASVIESAERNAADQAKQLENQLDALCKRHHVPRQPRGENPATASVAWVEERGLRNVLIGRLGRLADLVIVPRPSRATPPPSSFDAAVRESGRPVLMVPRKTVSEVSARGAAICWNASREAAQAMAAALPVLRTVGAVHILSSEKGMKQRPNANEVSNYLKCHGIEAKPYVFNAKGRSVGETLLSDAKSLGCNLLIVGGYSRPRLREMVMGGVTRHLIEHANLPVFMKH
ncbi:MAG: universal stress protein [Gammaproteobacteria bacterium]|nr:universal stress protein [Gammaproteobacteria bacterium]